MKVLGLLMAALVAFSMLGCGDQGGTSAADEAKLKEGLSKPPGVPQALRRPGGAKGKANPEGTQPGAGGSAPTPGQ